MQNFREIFIMILMTRLVSAGYDCELLQYNNECSCRNHGRAVSLQCPTSQNRNSLSYTIMYYDNRKVEIKCSNNTSLSTFHYEIRITNNQVETFSLKNCSLNEDVDLNNIARLVGAENAVNFEFSSDFALENVTLKKKLFRDFKKVEGLTITTNYFLTDLDEDLLEYLPKLRALTLQNNRMKSIPRNFFQNVSDIINIDLSVNKIQMFFPETFKNLKKLKSLNLRSNELVELDSNLFSNLVSLETLSIDKNNLTTLPQGIFDNLEKLRTVNISENPLHSLPKDLFKNNKNVSIVHLNLEKHLKIIPNGLFSNLTNLRDLSLHSSNFDRLPENLFQGSTQLRLLHLGHNALRTLPAKVFDGLTNLEQMHLGNNSIAELPDSLWFSCKNLFFLYLIENQITNITSDLFSGLTFLSILDMSKNRITNIAPTAFDPLENLKKVNLSHNNIITLRGGTNEFDVNSVFSQCTNLKKLDLSYNRIPLIYNDWIENSPRNLTFLNLSHNAIEVITNDDLNFKHLKYFTLDLSDNKISSIELGRFFEERSREGFHSFIKLYIEGNPIACDCNLYDLVRFLESGKNDAVQKNLTVKIGSMKCSSPKELQGTLLTDLKSKDYTCNSPRHLKYDNITPCPESCTQLIRPYDKTLIFDCSNKNLTRAPETLCNLEDPEYFTEVNLSHNLLKNIPKLNQNGYERVKTLSLSQNEITIIPEDSFSSALQTLKLHDNKIESLSKETLNRMNSSNLQSITLGGNPWKCNCDAREFQYFIQTSNFLIEDSENIICENSKQVTKMTVYELCSNDEELIEAISALIAILGMSIGGLAAIYYHYQTEIKVWLYARKLCLCVVTENELDKDKIYDAFISYSHKDEDFVINELVAKLEQGPQPYKLCIHFRDWLAGEWIPKQIAQSVQNSKRTIFVVSPNFMSSEWGKHEFRMAHSQALKDERIRVIVILYGDINQKDIQEHELKAYLETNTYVKWGDPWFWEKLHYGLPHKPIMTNKTPGFKIYERQHPSAQLNFIQNQVKQSSNSDLTTL